MGRGGRSIVFILMSVVKQVVSGEFFSHPWIIYFQAV